jgi:lysophospholipase L1-like esterase
MQPSASGYLRFASLGDSTTVGIGDPDPANQQWRGWAKLLADAMSTRHTVSFCNAAVSGATTSDVRRTQLRDAVDHRPDVASLIVGVNDTMRSTWSPDRIRDDLLHCAETLHRQGAILLTVRFHDHGQVLGLPAFLRRPLARRIEQVNAAYDEVHATYGGIRVDLAEHNETFERSFWSIDRLHPSERGHRCLANAFARRLSERGVVFDPPSLAMDAIAPTRLADLRWMVTEGAPWVGRRARDLGPWAARMAVSEARTKLTAV